MAKDKTGNGRVGRGITDHVYVDVDDTLLLDGGARVNWTLVENLQAWYRKRDADGANPCIVIWTMGGAQHARDAAIRCNLDTSMGFNTLCMAKPDLIVDNGTPEWFYKKFRVVSPEQFTI